MVILIAQTTQPAQHPVIGAMIGLALFGGFAFIVFNLGRAQWRWFRAQAKQAERSIGHMAAMEEKMDRLIGVLERRGNI